VDRHHLYTNPDPIYHFDADPYSNPDPNPDVGKSDTYFFIIALQCQFYLFRPRRSCHNFQYFGHLTVLKFF